MLDKILILGGYGAVGREAATALVHHLPEAEVIVAGRNPATAQPVPATTALRVDATDPAELAAALDGVDVVLMCAELDNARVARACLERGIHYLDVSATHHVLAAIEDLDDLADRHDATAVLSVGLVPGVTNLLARLCVERSRQDSPADEVRIGVLLGTGEHHGPAALAWTVDGLGEPGGSWTMRFPPPYGTRTVHRFPFSDQYTLPHTLGITTAATGLCLDSRVATALVATARRPGIARLLRHPTIRNTLLTALTKVHLGGDSFAVTVRSGRCQASFSGRRQSRATGLTAAHLIRLLPTLPAGVRHIDQLVDPVAFLTELATNGFVFNT